MAIVGLSIVYLLPKNNSLTTILNLRFLVKFYDNMNILIHVNIKIETFALIPFCRMESLS